MIIYGQVYFPKDKTNPFKELGDGIYIVLIGNNVTDADVRDFLSEYKKSFTNVKFDIELRNSTLCLVKVENISDKELLLIDFHLTLKGVSTYEPAEEILKKNMGRIKR